MTGNWYTRPIMNRGRIVSQHKTNYRLRDGTTEYIATVRGSFLEEQVFPCVGDYVTYSVVSADQAVIEAIEPRTSSIRRKAAGGTEEQVIAANVSLIGIVMGVDGDYNLSRLERYLLLASQSQIPAIIILNKIDVLDDVASTLTEVQAVAGDTPVLAVSAEAGTNMEQLRTHITPETTLVLLGSSGAGKSTITNWLLRDEVQLTAGVRGDDSRGRHTTTSRQLFALPGGGALIDTPGMRELGLPSQPASAEQDLFRAIEALAESCRFTNCDHDKSAGCAIQAALTEGEITEREYSNYQKLKRELEFQNQKEHETAAREYRSGKKKLQQEYNRIKKDKQLRR